MKTYMVEIVETLVKKVKALSSEEAFEKAIDNYHNEAEGYVLDTSDYVNTEFYPSQSPFVNS